MTERRSEPEYRHDKDLIAETLRQARSEFAKNGSSLYSRLAVAAAVPLVVAVAGYGGLQNQVSTTAKVAEQNREALREVSTSLSGAEHRIQALESNVAGMSDQLSNIDRTLREIQVTLARNHIDGGAGDAAESE